MLSDNKNENLIQKNKNSEIQFLNKIFFFFVIKSYLTKMMTCKIIKYLKTVKSGFTKS